MVAADIEKFQANLAEGIRRAWISFVEAECQSMAHRVLSTVLEGGILRGTAEHQATTPHAGLEPISPERDDRDLCAAGSAWAEGLLSKARSALESDLGEADALDRGGRGTDP